MNGLERQAQRNQLDYDRWVLRDHSDGSRFTASLAVHEKYEAMLALVPDEEEDDAACSPDHVWRDVTTGLCGYCGESLPSHGLPCDEAQPDPAGRDNCVACGRGIRFDDRAPHDRPRFEHTEA